MKSCSSHYLQLDYLCLVIAVFTRGLTLATRFWPNLVLAPLTIAIVVALIADLDSPSRGFIRLDRRAMQLLKADLAVQSVMPDSFDDSAHTIACFF
jgi:hypothetical protein